MMMVMMIVTMIGMVKMIYHYDGCARDSDTESAADTVHIYARSGQTSILNTAVALTMSSPAPVSTQNEQTAYFH